MYSPEQKKTRRRPYVCTIVSTTLTKLSSSGVHTCTKKTGKNLSLISLMVSVDVKHHVYLLTYLLTGKKSEEES